MSAAVDLVEMLREQSLDMDEPVVTLPPALGSGRPLLVPADALRVWVEQSMKVPAGPWPSTDAVLMAAAAAINEDPAIDEEMHDEYREVLEARGCDEQQALDAATDWQTAMRALRNRSRYAPLAA